MALNVLTIWCIFAVSLVVAFAKGVRVTYALIYLPVQILLYLIAPITLTHVPIEASYAPLYACLLAMPFRPEPVRFRPNLVDLVVVLTLVSSAITGFTTEGFEIGVNVFRTDMMRLAAPYFMARIVFQEWQPRRLSVYVLAAVMTVVTTLALLEFRLAPLYYQLLLKQLGMNNILFADHLTRFGFNRVTGVVDSPIFFGNLCAVLCGLVATLARTSGMRLRNPIVATTMVMTLMCVGMSISFTPIVGLISGIAVLAGLRFFPFARMLILPAAIAAVVGGIAYTAYVAANTTADDTHIHASDSNTTALEGSTNIRLEIIRQSWPVALSSGAFGRGLHPEFLDIDNFDLISVDNTYLYFTMTRGWVYTALWLSIAILFAGRIGRALGRVTDPSQVFPLCICASTVLSMMVAMYTVYAGSLYTIAWIIMLGLSNTLIDSVNASADARAGVAAPGMGRLRPPTVRMPVVASVATR